MLMRLEKLELHHKAAVFIAVLALTIIFVRIATLFYNPNPVWFGFELHHFDYGVVLLFISVLILLFGDARRYALCLLTTAIAFGLVLDELWFVREMVPYSDVGKATFAGYTATLPSVVILVVIVILAVLVVNHFKTRKRWGK